MGWGSWLETSAIVSAATIATAKGIIACSVANCDKQATETSLGTPASLEPTLLTALGEKREAAGGSLNRPILNL